MPNGAASRERCFDGVREVLNAMKVNRTFLCEREGLTTDIADLMPICTPSAKESSGMWFEDMADMSTANTELENDGSVVLLGDSSFCGGKLTTVATDETKWSEHEDTAPEVNQRLWRSVHVCHSEGWREETRARQGCVTPQGIWDKLAEKMLLEFAESTCPIFRATTPLSRGQLKSKGHGKFSIHFAVVQETIETICRINSANQLSLYGAGREHV